MADWTKYLKTKDAKDIPIPVVTVSAHEPWYDARKWNVNDWASFASIFGTGIFWILERNGRHKKKTSA